jgi:hypothetical protein
MTKYVDLRLTERELFILKFVLEHWMIDLEASNCIIEKRVLKKVKELL